MSDPGVSSSSDDEVSWNGRFREGSLDEGLRKAFVETRS